MRKIMIVEDDPAIRELLKTGYDGLDIMKK